MVCLEYHLPKFDAESIGNAEAMLHELLNDLRDRNAQIPTRRPHIAMPERRSGEIRYWLAVNGVVSVVDGEDTDKEEPVEIRDLSAGGCKLTCNRRFAPGAILRLVMSRPGNGNNAAEVLLEVRRSKRLRLPESYNYEVGCKRINKKTLQQITARRKMLESAFETLKETDRFHVIHLASGSGSQNARKALKAEGYHIESLKGAGQVLATLEESRGLALASLILAPASLVLRSPRPAWVTRLQRDYPGTSLVVIATSDAERGRLESIEGLQFAITADKVNDDLIPIIRAAFFANSVSIDDVMPAEDLKTLVIGRRELPLRRIQTFLMGSDYRAEKAVGTADALATLRNEEFHTVILEEDFITHGGHQRIERFRSRSKTPPLFIGLVEKPNLAEEAYKAGCSRVIVGSISPASLTQTLDSIRVAVLYQHAKSIGDSQII